MRRQLRQHRDRRVLRDRHRLDEPLVDPILGQICEPAAQRRARRAGPERPALDPELAARRAGRRRRSPARPRSGPRRRSRRGRRSRPAGARRRRRRRGRRARGPRAPEDDLADLRLLLREELVERAADHQPDDLALRQLARRPRRDVATVADDRDDVGERRDLLEPVADVEHGDAALGSRRTVAKRLSTSCGESAAVGSSMISSRALDESAFAISSSCRSATPSPRTGVSGRCRLELAQDAGGLARIAAQSTVRTRRAGGGPRRRSRRRRDPRTPWAPGTWRRSPSRWAACGSPIRRARRRPRARLRPAGRCR